MVTTIFATTAFAKSVTKATTFDEAFAAAEKVKDATSGKYKMQDMNRDNWMSAEEAKKYGIIDEIIK